MVSISGKCYCDNCKIDLPTQNKRIEFYMRRLGINRSIIGHLCIPCFNKTGCKLKIK